MELTFLKKNEIKSIKARLYLSSRVAVFRYLYWEEDGIPQILQLGGAGLITQLLKLDQHLLGRLGGLVGWVVSIKQ